MEKERKERRLEEITTINDVFFRRFSVNDLKERLDDYRGLKISGIEKTEVFIKYLEEE